MSSPLADQIAFLSNSGPDANQPPIPPSMKTAGDVSSPNPPSYDVAQDVSRIVTEIDKQERTTRNRMLRLWKYMELLWGGAGNFYWDQVSGQWRAITQEDITLLAAENDIDPSLLNKTVNMIRPYGESLAGVLTTGLPRVRYFPEDADNDLDIQASKAYSNVEERINNDNFMNLKLIEILIKMWNGGFAAAYNYKHTDKKYGTVTEGIFEPRPFTQTSSICIQCGNETLGEPTPVPPTPTPNPENEEREISSDTELSQVEQLESIKLEESQPPETSPMPCPNCMDITNHLQSNINTTQPVQTGTREIPKSRQIVQIYGPMNVKIPAMAVRKEHVIWLILEEEIHVALARHTYPEYRDKIQPYTNSDLDIDRIARATYEVSDDTLRNYCTIRKVWLQPACYEILEDEDKVKYYNQQYPDGIKALFDGETFLEAKSESMDEHWTVSINPLYPRIQCDPLGKALIGLHETANDLFQLEVDTVRYSIPSVYADPKYVDLEAHRQSRALPGSMQPAKSPPGGNLSQVFYETKTATIPDEVTELDQKIERLLQFISGVLPSVFGGATGGGSKTLGEYEQSRNQALQRLSIPWKVVSVMYAELMAKATRAYVDDLLEDEKFVKETAPGNYLNVWIRKADFEGSIGEVRPELSEQFPATWGQISDKVMQLLGMNNQVITSWFLHPENVELIYKVLGIEDLYVPGEDQRTKQLYEISQLILQQPTPTLQVDPQTGQPVPSMQSSIPIEQIDDDTIHMAVTSAFLNSMVGIDLKTTNPPAYQNVLLHYQEHAMRYQQAQMAQLQAQEAMQNRNQPGNTGNQGSEPVQ